MFTTLALLLAQSTPAAEAAAPPPIPPLAEAKEQVAAIDTAMFYYAFEGCDASKVRSHITEDFRMVHDQGGIIADNAEAFTALIGEDCDARAPGGKNEGYSSRRLLVPGSDSVTPLGQWGVLHRGMHTFQELRARPAGVFGKDDPGGPSWVTVGGARFLNIYQWMPEEGVFRMQETISIDHGSAKDPVPASAGEN